MDRLKQLTYRDRARALREAGEITRALPPAAANRFDLLLSASPAPEEGLHNFARLREQNPAAFQRLMHSTNGMRYLATVFTYSTFLSEEVVEHPDWMEQLLESGELHTSAKIGRAHV